MKTQKFISCLFLLIVFSCAEGPDNKIDTKISLAPVTLPELSSEESTSSNRLGVGRFYNVSNQWGLSIWSFKGDFNGDDKWDIISLNSYDAYVKLSQGEVASSYTSETWFTDGVYGASGYTFTGDFDGDGFSDIASAIAGNVHMKINNQSGGFNFTPWTVTNQWGASGYTVVGDFNGDGRDDIASCSGTNAFMKLSTGFAFQSVTWYTDGNFGGPGWTYATDYDGDGLDDLISANGSQIFIKKSTGSGFSNLTHNTSNTWGPVTYTWSGDTDNDGKGEIITAIGTTLVVREWNGTNTWGLISNSTQNLFGGVGYNWVMDQTGGTDGDELVSAIGNQIYVH